MPCGFCGNTGPRDTTKPTQWPPSGSTTSTCPSRSSSTSRVGSRGSVTAESYQIEVTQSSKNGQPGADGALSVEIASVLGIRLAGPPCQLAENLNYPNHIRAPDSQTFPLPSDFRA